MTLLDGNAFAGFGPRGIATMGAIELAALGEFCVRGFDETTAEHVAAAADVSPRSFFRYFPGGKEDVLALQLRRWIHALGAAVRARPPQESAWTALRAAVRAAPLLADHAGVSERAIALHQQLAQRHPGLHTAMTGRHYALAGPLVEMVALRMSVDPRVDIRPLLMVHSVLTAATTAWLAGLANAELDGFALFDEALDLVEAGMASL
jgi:AcrR family transcriptional regulator